MQNFQSISRNVRKIIINFPKIKKYFHNKIFYVVPIRQKSVGGGGWGVNKVEPVVASLWRI